MAHTTTVQHQFQVGDLAVFTRKRGEFYSGIGFGDVVEVTSLSITGSVSVQNVVTRGAHLSTDPANLSPYEPVYFINGLPFDLRDDPSGGAITRRTVEALELGNRVREWRTYGAFGDQPVDRGSVWGIFAVNPR